MGKFLNGVFIGIGIGLFIAPQTGEETRRLIMERVAALRQSLLSEDKTHLSINTQPSQVPPFLAQPAQPATESFGEYEVQGTPSVPATQPATESFGEHEVQGTPSVPATQPATEFFSEHEVQGTPSVPATQPAPEFFSEPQMRETPGAPATQPATESFGEPEEQATPRVPPAQPARELFSESQAYETPAAPVVPPETEFFNEPQVQGITMPPDETLSAPTDQNINVADTTSNIAHAAQTPESTTHPEEQTPTEAPHTDAAITDKLLPLSSPSNVPGRTARRKPSSRTSSTGKTNKGHGRS